MPQQATSRWHQAGWATYSAIMLFGAGIVGIVNSVWAFRYDDRRADLVVAETNLGLWGTVSLVVGVVSLAAGLGVFYGRFWARWTGIAVSVLAIVTAVAWAEIQSTQSLIAALMYGSVIYGLATNPVTVETSG
jgi:hypothetical protein